MAETEKRFLFKFVLCLQFVMALSNPLHGERRPGFVGKPLPGVQVPDFLTASIECSCNVYHIF